MYVFKGQYFTVNRFSVPYRSLSRHSRNFLWFTGNILLDNSSPKNRGHYFSSVTTGVYQIVDILGSQYNRR